MHSGHRSPLLSLFVIFDRMASEADNHDVALEDTGSDDGAELNKQRLAHEESESMAIDQDWEHLAATDTTSGSGWHISSLKDYGSTSFDVGDFFKCSPSGQTSLDALPNDHPIRAIFSLFKLAFNRWCDVSYRRDHTVRLYCDQLTDLYILDMLLHYSRILPIQIILHPQVYTFKKIRENADNFLKRAKASGVSPPRMHLSNLSN